MKALALSQQTLYRYFNVADFPMCQYVYSNKGPPMLVIDGYRFNLLKRRSNALKHWRGWRCSCKHLFCDATAMTVNDRVVAQGGTHNHRETEHLLDK